MEWRPLKPFASRQLEKYRMQKAYLSDGDVLKELHRHVAYHFDAKEKWLKKIRRHAKELKYGNR